MGYQFLVTGETKDTQEDVNTDKTKQVGKGSTATNGNGRATPADTKKKA
jgi:hypothetical protein